MGFLDIFKIKDKPSRKKRLGGADTELIRQEWGEIEQLLDLDKPSARNQALIRADKLIDHALKIVSTGETMGQRLKNAQQAFSNWDVYDGLWKAHKMRNALVHEAGFQPPHYTVKDALEKIKAGLEDLGISL